MKSLKRKLAQILALVLVFSMGAVPIIANAATTISEDFEGSSNLLTEISYGTYGEAGNLTETEYYDSTYENVWKMYLDGNTSDTYNRVTCATGETTEYVFDSDKVELSADIFVSGSDGGTASSDSRYAGLVAIISGEKIRLEFNYDDGKIYFGKASSPGLDELCAFSVDTWYNVRMVLDTTEETCDVYIDGTLEGDDLDKLISNSNTTPLLTLSLNDNTDNSSDLKSTCYVDNIQITDAIYTVDFDSQNGSSVDDITDVEYNTTITQPDEPTYSGHIFDGWYKDAACTTEWDFDNDTVTESTTLYAKWTSSDFWIDCRMDSFSDEDTTEKTIIITSAEELALLAYNVNDGMDYSGYTITLAEDIDLSGYYWTPIGEINHPFSGTFNGAGYSISGITVETTDQMVAGLFGYVNTGTITDVTVEGAVTAVMDEAATPLYVGGLAGYTVDTNISGCESSINMTATQNGNANLKVGSLVGWFVAENNVSLEDSCATGDVNAYQKNGNASGSIDAGGLVGTFRGRNGGFATLINAYSTGSVNAENLSSTTNDKYPINIGGLIGKLYSAEADNCYTTGDVTSWCEANVQRCGGLVGYILDNSSVSNAYASGAIMPLSAMSNNEATYAGDFTGYLESSNITNGYFLYSSSYGSIGDKDAAAAVASLTGLTAEQLANDQVVTSTYTTGTSNYTDIDVLILDALNTEASANGWEAWIDSGNNPVFGVFTVMFDSQGGSSVAKITDVTYGSTITAPNNPTRSGYSFAGWYTDTNYTTEWDFTANAVTSAMTLFAKWSRNSSGGSSGGSSTYSVTLTKVDKDSSTTYLEGATFKLYKGSGTAIGTYTTDDDGKIKVNRLSNGNYYFVETEAPSGYKLDTRKHSFTISNASESLTVTNSKNGSNTGAEDEEASADTPSVLNSTDHFKYVAGYPDGTVRPNGNVTRAEVTAMFYRLLTASRRDEIFTSSNSFSDVTQDLWYNKAVSSMASGGYISGYPEGSFGGNKVITRAEFVAIAARFMGAQSQTVSFTDVATTHWAYQHISTASYYGWISGYSDGTFRPNQPITRAEAMTIINRMLYRGVEADGVMPGFKEWSDNDSSEWYYYEVIEATNDHEYTGTRPSEQWLSLTSDYFYDSAKYERP
ncbi:InlB B-repeat-containing protein [Anaerotignum sp.]|uniref:InlB B-repeat-containing protein n=1 Tax=Anaerotignum sp. TaxID=2039241 RepID=UPI002714D42B|nr:InlB B-repeat-containing protein [Anaerotignum sp.]